MKINEFLDRINKHTIAIYENEIDQVSENGKIINWLLGLAGGALLFSFNQYDSINDDKDKIFIIIIQALIFVSTIIVGYLHRAKINTFRGYTTTIIRMFDFLKIEFELIPNEIENELKSEKLDTIFSNYLNGEYFIEDSKLTFDNINKNQTQSFKTIKFLTNISILLMVFQYGCFFLIIL